MAPRRLTLARSSVKPNRPLADRTAPHVHIPPAPTEPVLHALYPRRHDWAPHLGVHRGSNAV